MAAPVTKGRMIRRCIAVSRGVANLGPEATAIFTMILPHLDTHGKMLGQPGTVKEIALPLAKWATVEVVERALEEITLHTEMKWWMDKDGRRYIHALNFAKYQVLRHIGEDDLPSWPGDSSEHSSALSTEHSSALSTEHSSALSTAEVEVEVDVEVEKKKKCARDDAARDGAKGRAAEPPLEGTDPADVADLLDFSAGQREAQQAAYRASLR